MRCHYCGDCIFMVLLRQVGIAPVSHPKSFCLQVSPGEFRLASCHGCWQWHIYRASMHAASVWPLSSRVHQCWACLEYRTWLQLCNTATRTRNSCQWMWVCTPIIPVLDWSRSPCFEKYIRHCANGRAIDEMARRPLKNMFWHGHFVVFAVFMTGFFWNSLCRAGWPWTHRDPPVSTYWVLGL